MNLTDLDHYIGGDIGPSASGDLQGVVGITRGQQKLLRRLLTNPQDSDAAGDYIFHPTYGAGLPKYVGRLASLQEIKALIKGQCLLEDAVAKSPPPEVTVKSIVDGITVKISYTDADTSEPVFLSFDVNK